MKAWLGVLMIISMALTIDAQWLTADWLKFDIKDKEKIVERFNQKRREIAKKVSIPNMWKLEWSDDLVEKIKTLPVLKECQNLEPEGYRYMFVATDQETAVWLQKEMDDFQQLLDPGYNRDARWNAIHIYTGHSMEILTPEQKMVGCGPYKCPNFITYISTSDRPPGRKELFDFEEICLFAPSHSIQSLSFSFNPAAPGSKCEKAGGENEDGLCVPKIVKVESSASNGTIDSIDSAASFNFSIMVFMILLISLFFEY